MEQEKKKVNLKIVIPIIIAIVVVVGAIIILSLTTKIFWNYEKYMDIGEFEQAYEKAKNEDERESVIKANAIAYVVFSTMDIKMPTYDIVIKDAWYDNDKNIVLCVRNYVKDEEFYLYCAYNESEKDYDFVCMSDDPISIENITLADSYTKGIKNSGYSSAVQSIAINTMKQKLPDKLAEIMKRENRVTREVNISNYLLSDFVKLENDITLLETN